MRTQQTIWDATHPDDAAYQVDTIGRSRIFVQPEVFSENIDWMLNVVRDEPGLGFGIVGLYLEDWSDLQRTLGASGTLALAADLMTRFEATLRDADLAAWPRADAVHLLLPNNDAQRIPALLKALRVWLAELQRSVGAPLRWRATQVVVDHAMAAHESADSLLEGLSAGSDVLAAPGRMNPLQLGRQARAA